MGIRRRRPDRSQRSPGASATGEAVEAQPLDADGRPGEGILAGYRLVRRIAQGERATVYLGAPVGARTAVREAAGGDDGRPELVAVRIYDADADQARIALELDALAADAGRSLPLPYDLASFGDGRTCLVVERIAGDRLSQLISERTLSVGEAVTVLAPIAAGVRLLAEAGFVHTRLAAGDVLFDANGRPRLIGLGALARVDGGVSAVERSALLRDGHAALSRLLTEVAAATRPAAAFDHALALARAGLEARPFVPFSLELEHELFRVATPQPVNGVARSLGQLSRVPARIVPAPRVGPPAAIGAVPAAPASEPSGEPSAGRPSVLGPFAGAPSALGDERTADGGDRLLEGEWPLLAALRTGRWRSRLRAAVARRRRALLVGGLGGGAALVLMLTLVPPGTASSGAAEPPQAGTVVEETAAPAPEEAPNETGAAASPPEDLAVVAAELLELRDSCLDAADRACLSAVVQPGSALESADLDRIAQGGDGDAGTYDLATITVTGTMGQAVLAQLAYTDPERRPASLLMVRSEAGWRLREIFDEVPRTD